MSNNFEFVTVDTVIFVAVSYYNHILRVIAKEKLSSESYFMRQECPKYLFYSYLEILKHFSRQFHSA